MFYTVTKGYQSFNKTQTAGGAPSFFSYASVYRLVSSTELNNGGLP